VDAAKPGVISREVGQLNKKTKGSSHSSSSSSSSLFSMECFIGYGNSINLTSIIDVFHSDLKDEQSACIPVLWCR